MTIITFLYDKTHSLRRLSKKLL